VTSGPKSRYARQRSTTNSWNWTPFLLSMSQYRCRLLISSSDMCTRTLLPKLCSSSLSIVPSESSSYWSKMFLTSLSPSLNLGRRMVMLFTDLKVLCRDLVRSRSASATLPSRSLSTRCRLMGSVHMEATMPISPIESPPTTKLTYNKEER